MATADFTGSGWAHICELAGDIATFVLTDDASDLSADSTRRLQLLARAMRIGAAQLTATTDPRRPEEVANSADGIGDLRVPYAVYGVLQRAGVLTIADVRQHLVDGSILSIRGIGPKRADQLRCAIDRHDTERT